MRPSPDGASARSLESDAEIHGGHQITDSVSGLYLHDPCYIVPNDATMLVSRVRDEATQVLAAVERPHRAGDVVIVGDFEIFDDTDNLFEAGNRRFIDNLATVTPD